MRIVRAIQLITGSIAIASLAASTAAQDVTGAPPATAPAQYQVEVLVFAYREFDPTEEDFGHRDAQAPAVRGQALQPVPVFDDTNFGPRATAPAPLAQPPPEEFRFRLLRPDELQLTSQYRVLERLQAYHPLVHGGWVQLGLSENQALPVDLGLLGVSNPMGTVVFYVSRFLHVKLDVSYQDPLAPEPAPVAGIGGLAELPVKPRYHLSAERSARSGELHYFDHPAFGVLLKITPVRPEPNAIGVPGARPAA